MNKVITTVAAMFFGLIVNGAHAECAKFIVKATKMQVVRANEKLFVLVDPENGVEAVSQGDFPEAYAAISNTQAFHEKKKVGLALIESIDGLGKPALFLDLQIGEGRDCEGFQVGDRVFYHRANGPQRFWNAVKEWEKSHPEATQLILKQGGVK